MPIFIINQTRNSEWEYSNHIIEDRDVITTPWTSELLRQSGSRGTAARIAAEGHQELWWSDGLRQAHRRPSMAGGRAIHRLSYPNKALETQVNQNPQNSQKPYSNFYFIISK